MDILLKTQIDYDDRKIEGDSIYFDKEIKTSHLHLTILRLLIQ